jgi:hypothetical protein
LLRCKHFEQVQKTLTFLVNVGPEIGRGGHDHVPSFLGERFPLSGEAERRVPISEEADVGLYDVAVGADKEDPDPWEVNPLVKSQMGRINSKRPPMTSASIPAPCVTLMRLHMAKTLPSKKTG